MLTYKAYNENQPCEKCMAPCCKTLVIPQKTPVTWTDLDFIRYLLNFRTVKVIVSKAGDWSLLIEQNCIQFDETNYLCKVHGSIEQPKICVYFNPYQCYYKVNLQSENPADVYKLDRRKFEQWVQYVYFDENGQIVEAPSFETSLQVLRDLERTPPQGSE